MILESVDNPFLLNILADSGSAITAEKLCRGNYLTVVGSMKTGMPGLFFRHTRQ
jgi:hypothetical protein